MNLLSVENIKKSYGERVLFENVSFGIDRGQKVALIAKNGTGKTSLLRLLSKEDMPDVGNIIFRKDIKVGYLVQSPNYASNMSIEEAIFKIDSPKIDAIKAYNKAIENTDDAPQMQKAYELMEELDAWDYEIKIKQILGQLNIHDLSQKVEHLSGGQVKRIALAQVLIEEPDLFILDEPTNHLDLDMIEWLEKYLSKENVSLLMVTHDRYFLECVCNEIIELEDGDIYKHRGNYSYYLEKKQERETAFHASVDKAKNLYRKELEWMRRMPKARGTKSKSRQEAFYKTEEKAHKRLKNDSIQVEVNVTRLGSKIVEFHNVGKAYGDNVLLKSFEYIFKRKEKIGIVGKNGVGKTTFLNMLLGKESIDSGKIVVGDTVVFGYYSQHGISFKPGQRVIEAVKDVAEVIPLKKGKKITAAQLLERFMFDRKKQYDYIEKLSGGEQKRLFLLTILMNNPNFLILDEPTNDLDVITLNVLEDFLMDFEGCMIVVTHDRYFMDKLIDTLFVFEGEGKVQNYIGSYSDYRLEQKKKQQETNQKKESTSKKKEKTNSGLSYNLKREFETLDKEIPKLEEDKNQLTVQLNDTNLAQEEILRISTALGDIMKVIDEKTERWMELAALAEN